MKHIVRRATATYLLIVESPSKCAKIEGYLGPDYQCIASCGHIREIANGLSDMNHRYEPTFTWMEDKKDHIQSMRKVAKTFKSSQILLATDDDREGEAIAWHICEVLGISVETTPRIVFHEITQPALVAAVENPRRILMSVVKAQQARQVLDLLVGYKVSPFLWRVFYYSKTKALSAGRCQTPTLRLVYDNDRLERKMEIRYRTTAYFFAGHPTIGMDLNHEFETPDQVRAFLMQSKTHHHALSVVSNTQKEKSVPPPQPLTTSRLLQLASNVLRYTPKKTMQMCQTLYQQGRITYMRTDSSTYATPFLKMAQDYIKERYGAAEECPLLLKSTTPSSGDAAAAHEAIRVTDLHVTDAADGPEAAMYRLIWKNTVESCMSAARYAVFPLRVTAPEDYGYQYSIEIPTNLGWKRVARQKKDDDEDAASVALLTQVRLLQSVTIQHIRSTPASRNTHAHFTEASLVKKLEEIGIGRPSTYATLVETIQDRGYVKRMDVPGESREVTEFLLLGAGGGMEETPSVQMFGQEKDKLVIQPTGTACIEFLLQHFGELFAYDYTQRMEESLDRIANTPENETILTASQGYDLCHACSETIDRLAQSVSNLGKIVYPVDENHAIVFQTNGVVIRRTDPTDASVSYLPIAPDIDMDRAKNGQYTLSELMSSSTTEATTLKNRLLGKLEGEDVFLKHGRYGPYLEWKQEKKSLRQRTGEEEDMTLDMATEILLHRSPPPAAAASTILRTINADCSVREGKYGPYVYYKTSEMKSPMFFSLREFKCKNGASWKTATVDAVLAWVHERHQRGRGKR